MTILIVEDEKKIADSLKKGLEELDYEVTVAYDGKIGEKLFNQQPFDLIILDINLPGINGFELCTRIRQKNRSVLILMLTTLGSISDKVEGFDAGADDYMVKPFSFIELVVRVRALLKRTVNQNIPVGNILQFADLEMNLDTKHVSRSGKKILLTAKEFQLLEYLLRNKKRVVSRSEIGEHVWNIDFDTNTNTIEVYINYLRKKIDREFPVKLIHTQVGFGYIMKENELPALLKKTSPDHTALVFFDDLPENENLCTVNGNYELLLSAFRNIAENGCKYAPDHTVHISLSFVGTRIIVLFSNHYESFKPDEVEKIFQPFQRGSNAANEPGYGLGLSLTRRIILLHKGEIKAELLDEDQLLISVILPSAFAGV
jgi:two-component system copper resistance phosphate regulon response regulator CusR